MADVNGDASARVVVGQVVREPVDDLLDARAVFDNAAGRLNMGAQSLAAGSGAMRQDRWERPCRAY